MARDPPSTDTEVALRSNEPGPWTWFRCATQDECGGSPCPFRKDWPSDTNGNFVCGGNNQDWIDNVQPWLVPLKQACPTAYTYPFDDATANINCPPATGELVRYEITFCPS